MNKLQMIAKKIADDTGVLAKRKRGRGLGARKRRAREERLKRQAATRGDRR